MKPIEVSFRKLQNRDERSLAHMAAVARHDVYFGGARAIVLQERLEAMGSKLDYSGPIDQAYHNDDAPDFNAYECPECGTVCFGHCNAVYHCQCDEEEDQW